MPRDPSPLYPIARKTYDQMVAEVQAKKKDFQYIGKNMPRFDAYRKASGGALYTRDVQLPGMLYGKILTCPYAHARIKSIDTSKAEALPGVKAILTYKTEEIIPPTTIPVKDIKTTLGLPLLPQEANWEGEYVGVAVCAESEEICDEALKLIKIEWEELPFTTTVQEAMKDPANKKMETTFKRGLIVSDFPNYKEDETYDVTKGLKEADAVVENTIKLHPFPQTGAEPDSVVAKWEADTLTLWMHTQTQQVVPHNVSACLGIPASKLKLVLVYQGAMFGQGQLFNTQSARLDFTAALFAAKTKNPVRMLMSRMEYYYGGEAEMFHKLKIGAKKDGTITAVTAEYLIGQGAPGGYGTLWAAADHGANWIRYDLKCPYEAHYLSYQTNTIPKWWTRSEQNQNARSLQAVIDLTADALGMDPFEVFLKNTRMPEPSAKAVIEEGKKRIDWNKKWHKPGEKTLPNGKKHGIAFYIGHSWGNYTSMYNRPSAALTINLDGTVTIVGVKDDLGCSEHTTYAMIAAEEMGVRFEDVNYPLSDTSCGYAPQASGGAAGCHGNSWLFAKLGILAKTKVLELAAPVLKVKPEELDVKDSVIFVKADPSKKMTLREVMRKLQPPGGTVQVQASVDGYDWSEENVYGIFAPFHCYQAIFVEVEVDPETGQVDVTNVVTAYDVGKAIRPATVEGQLYGQAYMAVWRAATQSDIIHDPQTGVRLNANFLDTQISTCLDCGPIDPAWMEVAHSDGAYGNTGVGEMNITVVCAIIGAVHNAIGKWVDPPTTPEKVLKALGKA